MYSSNDNCAFSAGDVQQSQPWENLQLDLCRPSPLCPRLNNYLRSSQTFRITQNINLKLNQFRQLLQTTHDIENERRYLQQCKDTISVHINLSTQLMVHKIKVSSNVSSVENLFLSELSSLHSSIG